MKNYLFTPVVLLLLLVSCQSRLQELPDQEEVVAPVIMAVTETQPDTRTTLSDDGSRGIISWKPADGINVFFGTAGTHYVSQNSSNATEADFSTTDTILDAGSDLTNVWGLYPYNANATCNGSAVRTTLPASQYGVPGTFDDDLFIMLAHSSSNSLQFKNVCGGIKFSLSRNDITTITFKGNNNEDIAGDISLAFQDGVPAVTVVNGLKEITLTPKTGSTFSSGVNYYIATLPVTLSQGFTMTFRTSGGQYGSLRHDRNSVIIGRSAFSKKENIDTYVTFGNEDTYSKVMFIGNSLTRHPICSYWWGAWGMAATRRENDYVHRVMARLQVNVPSATYVIGSIGRWELHFDDHELGITQNDLQGTDLVVIRLGENVDVGYDSYFEDALCRLVDAIREFIDPRIVITGQFWTRPALETACINAAARTGATYVQINQYYTAEYIERVGNPVYGDDGMIHYIDNEAVAIHPSDLGMQMIAEEILNAILPVSQ